MKKRGFTLIELLIVVAIIGILAAIAIPNFLLAQVRAKVARAKAEMQTVATGLESYAVDNNEYPDDYENGWPWYLTKQLTTPIKYISSASLNDPFREHLVFPSNIYPLGNRYRYINYEADLGLWPGISGPDYSGRHWWGGANECRTGMNLFGVWKFSSAGPDQTANVSFLTVELLYDPSNGTVSLGDIIRSQKKGLAD